MRSPTEKQIQFVDQICKVLSLHFPTSSKEFNRSCFSSFISTHLKEFNDELACHDICDDVDWVYEYTGCVNDVWCEYY